jgi:hypothetical protein
VLSFVLACAAAPVGNPAGPSLGEIDPADTGSDLAADTAADSGTGAGDPGDDTGGGGAPGDTSGDGLLGTRLDPPWAAPAFSVFNSHGAARDAAWLAGHPTVLWFFREATGST